MKSPTAVAIARASAIVLILWGTAMPARAEPGYEQEPVLNAKDLATPELLSGPHFTVDPKVPVRGFIERFTIRSKYGSLIGPRSPDVSV